MGRSCVRARKICVASTPPNSSLAIPSLLSQADSEDAVGVVAVGKEAEEVFGRDGIGNVGGQEGARVFHDKFVVPFQKRLNDLFVFFGFYAASGVNEDAAACRRAIAAAASSKLAL
jgi:hypothetical protein